jgi:hypothetical protein
MTTVPDVCSPVQPVPTFEPVACGAARRAERVGTPAACQVASRAHAPLAGRDG